MDTRKIYYIYKNVKRDISPLKMRINHSQFNDLLLQGDGTNGDDWFITSLLTPDVISDFVDEWSIEGFSGEYIRNFDDTYSVKGDVLLVTEVKCPYEYMDQSEFMNMPVEDLVVFLRDKLVNNALEFEKIIEFTSSYVPPVLDILSDVEFKPVFDKLRMIVKNNVGEIFYDFNDYKSNLKNDVRDFCDAEDLQKLIDYRDVAVYKIAYDFSHNIKNDFNFNNEPFIITDKMIDKYTVAIADDVAKEVDDYINQKKAKKKDSDIDFDKLEKDLAKGGIKK